MTDLVQRLVNTANCVGYGGSLNGGAVHKELLIAAADALEAKDKEIATMRYENAIRFDTSHPEMYKTALDEAKDEIARLNTEYQEVCRLVAQMHLAAVGGVVGPKLGVIEDVKAMKESHDKYKALCDQMAYSMEMHGAPFLHHELRYQEALAAWREMK